MTAPLYRVVESSRLTIEAGLEASMNYHAFPYATVYPDGEFLLSWIQASSHGNIDTSRLCTRRSSDGATWTPRVVGPVIKDWPTGAAALPAAPLGVHRDYLLIPKDVPPSLHFTCTDDRGASFATAVNFGTAGFGEFCFTGSRPFLYGPESKVIFPVYGSHNSQTEGQRIWLMQCDPNGTNLERRAEVHASPLGGWRVEEPQLPVNLAALLAATPGVRWRMTIRSDTPFGANVFVTFSDDKGRQGSWTPIAQQPSFANRAWVGKAWPTTIAMPNGASIGAVRGALTEPHDERPYVVTALGDGDPGAWSEYVSLDPEDGNDMYQAYFPLPSDRVLCVYGIELSASRSALRSVILEPVAALLPHARSYHDRFFPGLAEIARRLRAVVVPRRT